MRLLWNVCVFSYLLVFICNSLLVCVCRSCILDTASGLLNPNRNPNPNLNPNTNPILNPIANPNPNSIPNPNLNRYYVLYIPSSGDINISPCLRVCLYARVSADFPGILLVSLIVICFCEFSTKLLCVQLDTE